METSLPDLVDCDMVDRARQGVQGDVEEILRRHRRLIGSKVAAVRRVAPWAEEDDLVSEAHVAILEAIRKFSVAKGKRFTAFLLAVVRRKLLNYAVRRGRPLARGRGRAEGVPEPADPASDRHLLSAEARDLLTLLPARQRRVVELHLGMTGGAPLTFDRVAPLVGISKQRAHELFHAAVEQLRWRG